MVKGINNSFYHYKTYTIDKDNNIINEQYFMTAKEISNLFNVAIRTINYTLKNPTVKSRKLGNIRIERVKIPNRITIENPIGIKKIE